MLPSRLMLLLCSKFHAACADASLIAALLSVMLCCLLVDPRGGHL
jgi:hypothetical protein